MHDQKLTEELEFLRSSPEYLTFMYGHIKEPERNKQADRLFRRGMPQTAAAMVMEDVFGKNYVPPTIMRPEFTGYEYLHEMPRKPIDHPYLLPPSTNTIANRTRTGDLWWVKGKDSVLYEEGGYPLHDDYQTIDANHFRMNSNMVIHVIKGHFDR